MLFLRNIARCCFFTTKNRKSDLHKAKYLASLDRLEKQLNKEEEELGYQRHFIAVGNRIRRATKEM